MRIPDASMTLEPQPRIPLDPNASADAPVPLPDGAELSGTELGHELPAEIASDAVTFANQLPTSIVPFIAPALLALGGFRALYLTLAVLGILGALTAVSSCAATRPPYARSPAALGGDLRRA